MRAIEDYNPFSFSLPETTEDLDITIPDLDDVAHLKTTINLLTEEASDILEQGGIIPRTLREDLAYYNRRLAELLGYDY